MHISEGVLNPPLLLAGAGLALVGAAIGLKKMNTDQVVKVAILSAVFYLASLIHVPLGPSSVHLVLNGLLGLLLGWVCVPAIFVGLLLQAVIFQYGGLTVLGVNTVIMALPALVSYYLFRPLLNRKGILSPLAGFACGATAVFLGAILIGLFLALNGEAFRTAAYVAIAAHAPVLIIEGVITAFIISFLQKVKPEIVHSASPNR